MLRFSDGTQASAIFSQVSGGHKNDLFLAADCENYSMQWRQQAADQLIIGRREGGEHTIYADPAQLSAPAKRFATLTARLPEWDFRILSCAPPAYCPGSLAVLCHVR